jgi:hypothetical protein
MRNLISYFYNKYFIFPKNNKIPWSQDFCYYNENAPSKVKFKLDKILIINPMRITLVAKGYGDLSTQNHEDYGNGAICVELEDVLQYLKNSI